MGWQQEELEASHRAYSEVSLQLNQGQAREWGTVVWDGEHVCCRPLEAFSEELRMVFNRSAREFRRHESCFSRASSPGTPSSSAHSPHPVAGTRKHSGITFSMAWLNT